MVEQASNVRDDKMAAAVLTLRGAWGTIPGLVPPLCSC